MKALIDTIFSPFLNFLDQIILLLNDIALPLNRPIDLTVFFGPFALIGGAWLNLIESLLALLVLYFVIYMIMNATEFLGKFKNSVKWW